jgi:hypothetical protein
MAAAPSTTQAPPASTQASQGAPAAAVPFVRGSGLGRYKFFEKTGLSLSTSTQDLGPIDVKAYDYMRSILIKVVTTATGTTTAATTKEDGPFNVFTNVAVKQPNGQTMYAVSSGFSAAMIHKYGGYQGYNDPRAWNDFAYSTGSSTAPTYTFAFRIPFELNIRDALGALPNKNAAAPFSLELTLNTAANVYGGTLTTMPTFKVQAFLEAWDQPPSSLGGAAVETAPPAKNTLQRWTEQSISVSAGQFDARVRKLGNYVRMLVPILRRTSGTRANGESDWPDPVQIVLDEDVKDNITYHQMLSDRYEKWGYGGIKPAGASSADATEGYDNGVFPYDYCHEFDGRVGHEYGDLYLPTIESEDYLFRGSWVNAGTITCLVNEVLPQGDIFSVRR